MKDILAVLPPFFGPAGLWAAFAVIAVALIRAAPAMFRTRADADDSLRGDLLARISELERQLDKLRGEVTAGHANCEKILAEVRAQHALEMHELRERHLLELGRVVERKAEGGMQ